MEYSEPPLGNSLYKVTLIAIFLAAYIMKNLTFHNQHEADLEDILILISYTGLLVFIIFRNGKKPGREFITFLLVSNFAMWAINTFETQTPQHNPIQVEFYGVEAWAIFTHISVPLGIYYRFHSTVCFSNI